VGESVVGGINVAPIYDRRKLNGLAISRVRFCFVGLAVALVRGRSYSCASRNGFPVPSANRILDAILRGTSDANIPFDGLRSLLSRLGFQERVKGSHRIFWRQDVAEILNLQPKGSKAKPYQVKQVRAVLLKYKLGGMPDV
jgi:predicted RNA binding protein YcfA (HicA-like mRNA interferase family)